VEFRGENAGKAICYDWHELDARSIAMGSDGKRANRADASRTRATRDGCAFRGVPLILWRGPLIPKRLRGGDNSLFLIRLPR
jgi:hypothetical protein